MVRYIDNFSVIQRTSDGYFNATHLLKQWNEHIKSKSPDLGDLKTRGLDNFWKSTNLTQLMSKIAKNELDFKSVEFTELKNALSKTCRGKRNGGTWMHPFKKIRFSFGSMESLRNFAVRHFYIHTWFVDFLCPQISYCLQYKQRFLRTYSPTSQYESVATWRNSLLSLLINF